MKKTVKTSAELYDQNARIWRYTIDRTIKLAAIADPRTGGNEMLIHNWGNEAARAVWAQFWDTNAKISLAYRKLYTAAFRRQFPDHIVSKNQSILLMG